MQLTDGRDLLTEQEAAEVLGRSLTTVRQWIRTRRLKSVWITPTKRVVDRREVERLLAKQ